MFVCVWETERYGKESESEYSRVYSDGEKKFASLVPINANGLTDNMKIQLWPKTEIKLLKKYYICSKF